jgi:sec-independent protein translocase protein TatA
MGGFSPIHIIIVLLLIVLLFGAGKVSNLMGDVAKGIKSFKKGMAEDDAPEPARRIATEQPLDARPIPAPPPADPVATPVSTPDPDRHA